MFLSTALKQTGALVKREVPIPDFQQLNTALPNYDSSDIDPHERSNSLDAIMDVVAHLPSGVEFLIDASIRNPLALLP